MNFIDIIIVIFVGCSCFQGYRRGFIKTLFDTIGLIVAFFLSKEFYYLVEEFLLTSTKLYDKVHNFFDAKSEKFYDIFNNGSNNIVQAFEDILKLPVEMQNLLSNIFNSGNTGNVDSYSVFVDSISSILVRTISFLITFLIIYILLVILSNIINTIFKLPVLNLTNRVFGGITGVLKSIVVLYLVFALSSPLISFMQDSNLAQSIIKSESSKIFYDNNIILNYLSYKGFYQ